MWWVDPQHDWQLGLLAAGGLVLLLHLLVPALRKGNGERALLVLMGAIALGSAAAYTRFGDFQGPRRGQLHTIHDHDIYHYAIGAKYYPELGHELLYECTWLAFAEMRSAGTKCPKVPRLRSLRNPDEFFNPNHRRPAIEAECHEAFRKKRWNGLKTDLRAWLAVPWSDQPWRAALVDLGYNPPPTYNVIAHNLANLIPIDASTLHAFPFVDMTLVLVGAGLIGWAFGPWAAFAYLVIFGTNFIASYRWTGGSFCRQLWFVFLVYASCFLKKEHYAWAGAMLALSASMRIFPLVFVVGAVVGMGAMAWREPERRGDFKRLVGSGLATAAGLGLISLIQFGPDLWRQFFDKMSHHGTSWFMWHIGFKKYAVFYPEVAENSGVRLLRGWWWAKPATWEAVWNEHRFLHEAIRIGLSLGALAVAWRRPVFEGAMVFGAIVLFSWSMPANYYYVYMALMPAVFYDRDNPFAALRIALVFAAMLSLSMSPWVHREPIVMNGHMNRTIFWFFVLLLTSYGAEVARERWIAR